MLQFSVIGNLGADARVEEANGRKFVSFNVGHNERWTNSEGRVNESTLWVSCAMNGDGGGLLPYLTKGRQVFVSGRGSVRVFSSPKNHRMEAGVNISVDRLELIGGQGDDVPRRLYDQDGVQVDVAKFYYVPFEKAIALGAKDGKPATLMSQGGDIFNVSVQGYVTRAPKPAENDA